MTPSGWFPTKDHSVQHSSQALDPKLLISASGQLIPRPESVWWSSFEKVNRNKRRIIESLHAICSIIKAVEITTGEAVVQIRKCWMLKTRGEALRETNVLLAQLGQVLISKAALRLGEPLGVNKSGTSVFLGVSSYPKAKR